MVGALGRDIFIKELAVSRTCCINGPKASVSRWWSWMLSHFTWDGEHHTRMLILAGLAVRSGWTSSWEDLFSPLPLASLDEGRLATGGHAADDAPAAAAGAPSSSAASASCAAAAADDDGAAAGAASSSSVALPCAPPPAAGASLSEGSQAKDNALAKSQLKKLREKCQNKLHAAVRFMGDLQMTYSARMIAIVTKTGCRSDQTNYQCPCDSRFSLDVLRRLQTS